MPAKVSHLYHETQKPLLSTLIRGLVCTGVPRSLKTFRTRRTTSLAPVHRQSAARLGVKGSVLFTYLINKARLQVSCHSYLTRCNHQLVLESQLPHQIVNSLFASTHQHIKSTVWSVSRLPKPIHQCGVSDKVPRARLRTTGPIKQQNKIISSFDSIVREVVGGWQTGLIIELPVRNSGRSRGC